MIVPHGAAEPKTEEAFYFPSLVILSISCSAEDHTVVPTQQTPDPDDPLGWVFSGEPECAPGDVVNDMRENEGEERVRSGWGAIPFMFTHDDTGTLATAVATDTTFGADAGYLTLRALDEEGDASAEGCGAQSIVLPKPTVPWQGPPPEWAYWWTFIDPIGVDEDLTVCFATTGIVHGTWGA